MSHVRNGTTSIDELLRVLEMPSDQTDRASVAQARRAVADGGVVEADAPVPTPAPRATPGASPLGDITPADLVPPSGPASVKTLHAPPPPTNFDSASFQLLDEGSANNGKSKKVLLVEDEDALRRVMKDLLEREGFTVFEAADGVKALDEIDRAGPDIVVLDLNLPRLDGYGVLSHLRSRPATADLPVIVLTAKGDEDSEVRVFEYGASDYLTKPFRPRALSARLHSLLGRIRE